MNIEFIYRTSTSSSVPASLSLGRGGTCVQIQKVFFSKMTIIVNTSVAKMIMVLVVFVIVVVLIKTTMTTTTMNIYQSTKQDAKQ